MLHYPGGITDEQWARLVTYNEMSKGLFYDFHRTAEITLRVFLDEWYAAHETFLAQLTANAMGIRITELVDDPEYLAFLERADLEYDEGRLHDDID